MSDLVLIVLVTVAFWKLAGRRLWEWTETFVRIEREREP